MCISKKDSLISTETHKTVNSSQWKQRVHGNDQLKLPGSNLNQFTKEWKWWQTFYKAFTIILTQQFWYHNTICSQHGNVCVTMSLRDFTLLATLGHVKRSRGNNRTSGIKTKCRYPIIAHFNMTGTNSAPKMCHSICQPFLWNQFCPQVTWQPRQQALCQPPNSMATTRFPWQPPDFHDNISEAP